jgi:hypothetical protein
MTQDAKEKSERARKIVNGSGFPLQIAVEHLVKAGGAPPSRVLYTEHAWADRETGEGGFIDLILEKPDAWSIFVVECKRVLESSWIFLAPSKESLSTRRHAKVWETQFARGQLGVFGWVDRAMEPRTPESSFCVVDGQDSKSVPMLERVASTLVTATEAFARDDAARIKHQSQHFATDYVSVIVTTARLLLAQFDPAKITVADGTVPSLIDVEVPYLRFRKQLSGSSDVPDGGESHDTRAIASARERTVFVVNAQLLPAFMREFEVDERPR